MIKDRLAPSGYPADGMMSSSILNAGNKGKLKSKFGQDWDYMSEKEKDKLEKEEMDKEEVEKGTKASKGKLTDKDKATVKELDELSAGSNLVNYTKRENPNPGPKT